MIRFKLILSFVFVIFFILFFGCDDTIPNDIDIPSENVSYNRHIQPVLNFKCATNLCHDSATRAGNYSMQSWTETNTSPYVIAGDPRNSVAVLVASGEIPPLMPPQNSSVLPLTDRELEGFKTWIREGAKNN